MTIALKLVRGLPPAPNDTRTNEGQTVINLNATSGSPGFGLTVDGYNPGYPSLKGGNWIDSTTIDGRRLQSDTIENVTDTITLKVTAPTWSDLDTYIVALNRFIEDARAFFTTFSQIEPVYLEWQGQNAPGSQYALVYNIDASIQIDRNSSTPVGDVVLVVEREGAWRGIPPGANPRVWAYYAAGTLPGSGYDYQTMAISDTSTTTSINNKNEYNPASTQRSTPLVENWIDVSDVPGDAPALTAISVIPDTTGTLTAEALAIRAIKRLYVWRNTKQLEMLSRESAVTTSDPPIENVTTINGVDGDTFTNVTRQADATNGVNSASPTIKGVARAATTSPASIVWDELSLATRRGKYMVFARGYQTGGTAGGVTLSLSVSTFPSQVTVLDSTAAVVSTGNVNLTYLGVLDLPASGRTPVNPLGWGQLVHEPLAGNLQALKATLTITGATSGVTYSLIDLVFIGIDEDNVVAYNPSLKSPLEWIFDNTGYFKHGDTGTIYTPDTDFAVSQDATIELIGNGITLTPGKTNRVYAFAEYAPTNAYPALTHANVELLVNIWYVPRWYGARDE